MKTTDAIDVDRVAMRRAAEKASHDLEPLVDHAFDGMLVVDVEESRVLHANHAAEQLADRRTGELTGTSLQDILAFNPPVGRAILLTLLTSDELLDYHMSASLRMTNDATTRCHVRICRVMFAGQWAAGIIFRPDIEENVALASVEIPPNRRDPLTGMADRTFALSRLEHLLANRQVGDPNFALLFIDLDNFKQVNDSHGHLVGDRVLKEVAARLESSVRAGDHIARYGGDEFVVLLEGLRHGDEVERVIARIHSALSFPIELPNGRTQLAVSIGIARPSDNIRTTEELLAEADRAMYTAKRDQR